MKRHILLIVFAALAFCLPSQAQSSSRAQEIQRVVDGQNTANPVERIVAFEEAFEKGDATIRRIALDTAFSGSDLTLHSVAVEQLLSTKSSYMIRIIEPLEGSSDTFEKYSAGSFDYRVVNFDLGSGDFLVYSTHSTLDKKTNQREAHSGNFSGDRMVFSVSVGDMYANGRLVCHVEMSLSEKPGVMAGTMTCGNHGNYRVETDLRR